MKHSGIRLEDLGAKARAQVAALLGPKEKAVSVLSNAIRQKKRGGASLLQLAFLARLRADHQGDGVTVLGEEIKLQIANGTTYRPDCWTIEWKEGGAVVIKAFEVKGPQYWAAARVKNKVAARAFPWINFYLVTRGGIPPNGWQIERILP